MLSAANQFSADCIMNTRWWLQAPDPFLRTTAWRDFSADMLLVLATRLGLRPTLKLAA
jgi:hypothetical protein